MGTFLFFLCFFLLCSLHTASTSAVYTKDQWKFLQKIDGEFHRRSRRFMPPDLIFEEALRHLLETISPSSSLSESIMMIEESIRVSPDLIFEEARRYLEEISPAPTLSEFPPPPVSGSDGYPPQVPFSTSPPSNSPLNPPMISPSNSPPSPPSNPPSNPPLNSPSSPPNPFSKPLPNPPLIFPPVVEVVKRADPTIIVTITVFVALAITGLIFFYFCCKRQRSVKKDGDSNSNPPRLLNDGDLDSSSSFWNTPFSESVREKMGDSSFSVAMAAATRMDGTWTEVNPSITKEEVNRQDKEQTKRKPIISSGVRRKNEQGIKQGNSEGFMALSMPPSFHREDSKMRLQSLTEELFMAPSPAFSIPAKTSVHARLPLGSNSPPIFNSSAPLPLPPGRQAPQNALQGLVQISQFGFLDKTSVPACLPLASNSPLIFNSSAPLPLPPGRRLAPQNALEGGWGMNASKATSHTCIESDELFSISSSEDPLPPPSLPSSLAHMRVTSQSSTIASSPLPPVPQSTVASQEASFGYLQMVKVGSQSNTLYSPIAVSPPLSLPTMAYAIPSKNNPPNPSTPPPPPKLSPSPSPPPPPKPSPSPAPPPPPPPPPPKPAPSPPPPPPPPAPPSRPPQPPAPPRPFKLPSPPKSASSNTGANSSRVEGTKDPDNTRKLKPFHWDKVQADPSLGMVWDRLRTGSFQLNEDVIETLFGSDSTTATKDSGKPKETSIIPKKKGIIDSKKAQNISIQIRALNLKRDEICGHLLEGDGIDAELLEVLTKMCPTPEEQKGLRSYGGDLSELSTAECFLKAVLEVPFAFERMKAMLFKACFDDDLRSVQECIQNLEVACKEVRESRLLLKLLEAVLKTGNRMNQGTFRGNAEAFKLETLLKLSDVRSADGKTTLLQFVVKEIAKSEGGSLTSNGYGDENTGLHVSRQLNKELGTVKKVANIGGTEGLLLSIQKLESGHVGIKRLIEMPKLMKGGNEDDSFCLNMTTFVEQTEENMKAIRRELSRVLEAVKQVAAYFHGAPTDKDPLRLFVILQDFLGMLEKVCIDSAKTSKRPRG